MSQTAQAVVQNLVDRAVKLGDRQLAADTAPLRRSASLGLYLNTTVQSDFAFMANLSWRAMSYRCFPSVVKKRTLAPNCYGW